MCHVPAYSMRSSFSRFLVCVSCSVVFTCIAPSAIPAASSFPVVLYATLVTPTRAALGVVGLTTVFCKTLCVSQILPNDATQT